MAGKTHPYLQTAYMSALVFFSMLLVIIFIALYVQSKSVYQPDLPAAAVEQNIAPPGKIYPRK